MPPVPIAAPVAGKFATYPEPIRAKLAAVRDCIYAVAHQQQLGDVSETLKWGEPSYQVTGGSPIRLGCSAKQPEQLALYCHCQTSLIATFKELYPTEFCFVGNREMRLPLDSPIPNPALEHCIELALTYHKIKHLPLLGA